MPVANPGLSRSGKGFAVLISIRLLFCALSVFIVSFFPGYLISGSFKSLNREERIASSPAISFFIIGFFVFIRFLLDLPFYFPPLLLVILLLIYRRNPIRCWREWSVGIFMLTFSHLAVLEILTPVFEGAGWYGDWWEHFDRSLFYLGGGDVAGKTWFGYNAAARTPLMHLNAAFFMGLFGEHFRVFQIVNVFHNCCFVLSIYLLFRRFFDGKTARIVLFFLVFNPWLINNALYTWPKLGAAYPLLLALYFYLKFREDFKSRNFFWFIFQAAAASMIHQMALVCSLFFLVDMAILVLRGKWRPTAVFYRIFIGIVTVVAAPWYIWVSYRLGIREVILAVPTIAKLAPNHFFAYLYGSLHSLAGSLIPVPLIAHFLMFKQISFYDSLLFYFNTLAGAMTISLCIAVTVESIKKRKSLLAAVCRWRGEWFFLLMGTALFILGLFHHDRFMGNILSILGGLCCLPFVLSLLPDFRAGCKLDGKKLGRSPVFLVGVFIVWGYAGSIITHLHTLFGSLGVFAPGAIPSVLLTVAAAVYFLRNTSRRFMIITFCGVLMEFIIAVWNKWLVMERYLAEGMVYFWGRNWDLKVMHQLDFARDGLHGDVSYWVVAGILLEVFLAGYFFVEIFSNPNNSQ